MSKINTHSKILAAKTREVLRPAGIIQKGRSRFWYDDKSWYSVCIEFVPGKYERGISLHVGITWLWYPKPYWSYDITGLRNNFVEFQSDEQFSSEVTSYIQQALEMTGIINTACATFSGAYRYSSKSTDKFADKVWQNLHLGILAILSGKLKKGLDLIGSVERQEVKHEWEEERRLYCQTALTKAQDLNEFRRWIEENIRLSRSMKKMAGDDIVYLPPIESENREKWWRRLSFNRSW